MFFPVFCLPCFVVIVCWCWMHSFVVLVTCLPCPIPSVGFDGNMICFIDTVVQRNGYRMDRVVNLAIGVGMCFVLANVGHGAYQLANGTGRKEGF